MRIHLPTCSSPPTSPLPYATHPSSPPPIDALLTCHTNESALLPVTLRSSVGTLVRWSAAQSTHQCIESTPRRLSCQGKEARGGGGDGIIHPALMLVFIYYVLYSYAA